MKKFTLLLLIAALFTLSGCIDLKSKTDSNDRNSTQEQDRKKSKPDKNENPTPDNPNKNPMPQNPNKNPTPNNPDSGIAAPPFTPPTAQTCEPSGLGTDYQVGPGKDYSKLSDINWDNLKPGDTVRIFYKPTPYKEKIVIRTSGTEDKPLRVCGVPGPNGKRPILDGNGAVNDPDDASAYTTYEPMEGLAMIMIYNRDYTTKDSHITIDGLHIRNAKKGFNYTRVNGSSSEYENGAACIRVQAGDNIIIRNNEIENCGNGIFTMSQGYNEAHLTRNILIEGNYFHKNSQPNSYREHALYIQAIGAIYQYNYFGPNAEGSQGSTLKERVAGSIIRYNWFDSGSVRSLDLVEVEDAAPWYIESEYRKWAASNGGIDNTILKKVQDAEKLYRKTYVYGNFFNHIGSKTEAGNIVHYGNDNDPELSRNGTLYFYNNTLSIRQDRDDAWRFRLFYLGHRETEEAGDETIELYNNIIYFSSENKNKEPSYLCLNDSGGGTINFSGINWLNGDWNNDEAFASCHSYNSDTTINGISNIIGTSDSQIPIDLDTLLPKDLPSIKNQSVELPDALVNFPVTKEYIKHLNFKDRDNSNDLGAAAIP